MTHEPQQLILTQENDKKTIKRKLARRLIQQIIQLYSTIIQKIQHGIGLLWQEYISQELYSLAKKRVQNDIINNFNELEDWFQNIAQNIKDKFNSLSENLMGHFNTIIQNQLQSIERFMEPSIKFTQAEQIQANRSKDSQSNDENKQSLSLYETCTQSSKQEQNGVIQLKKLCLACEDHLNQAFGYCSKHQYLQYNQQQKNRFDQIKLQRANKFQQQKYPQQKQIKQNVQFLFDKRNRYQSPKRRKKAIQSIQNEQKEDQCQGSFYEVFFGLLDAFQM